MTEQTLKCTKCALKLSCLGNPAREQDLLEAKLLWIRKLTELGELKRTLEQTIEKALIEGQAMGYLSENLELL